MCGREEWHHHYGIQLAPDDARVVGTLGAMSDWHAAVDVWRTPIVVPAT